jgi:lipopolysaccharide export LptBFGC system permease protein LptF
MQVLAERNYLSPVLAAWAPDVVFGLRGVILLLREE